MANTVHLELEGVMESSTLLSENFPPMCEQTYRTQHGFQPLETPTTWEKIRTNTRCTKGCLLDLVPIFQWLPQYDFKNDFLWDLIAGLTVSVLLIPHGLAFAPLGGQEPVVGLYMGVFPIIIYVIFGTSRHISLGMQAILIMMVGKIVSKYSVSEPIVQNGTIISYSPLEVSVVVTFTIGLWELILGLLQLGSLCVLLTNSLVSGLTSAAAIHIIFIQLKQLFGIPLSMATGPLKLIFVLIDFVKKVSETNFVTLGISCAFILFLYTYNEFLKPVISKRSRVPVPIEFILVALGIILSEFLNLEKFYNVWVVGKVPNGLPTGSVPSVSLIPSIAIDCLIIAVVNVSINISLAKLFAKKGGYVIKENQELIAYGLSNIFGGFFQCLPVCAALTRSMVQFSVGGKTAMAHAVSLINVLVMLLFLGPIFEKVPQCVLAAIVFVSAKPLFMQVTEFPGIWRASKFDGIVWLTTFLSVILVDIDYGIGIGLTVSILTLILNSIKTRVQVLGQIGNRFVDTLSYPTAENNSQVIILKIIGGANFVNAATITREIQKVVDPFWVEQKDSNNSVIIDFSAVPYVDSSFVDTIINFLGNFKEHNCQFIITDCSYNVFETFEKCGFFEVYSKDFVMISIHSALKYLHDLKLVQ